MSDFKATAETYTIDGHVNRIHVNVLAGTSHGPALAVYNHAAGNCVQQILTPAEARAFAEVLTQAADAAEAVSSMPTCAKCHRPETARVLLCECPSQVIEHDPAEAIPWTASDETEVQARIRRTIGERIEWTADDEADERRAAEAMEDGPRGDRDRYRQPGSAW